MSSTMLKQFRLTRKSVEVDGKQLTFAVHTSQTTMNLMTPLLLTTTQLARARPRKVAMGQKQSIA